MEPSPEPNHAGNLTSQFSLTVRNKCLLLISHLCVAFCYSSLNLDTISEKRSQGGILYSSSEQTKPPYTPLTCAYYSWEGVWRHGRRESTSGWACLHWARTGSASLPGIQKRPMLPQFQSFLPSSLGWWPVWRWGPLPVHAQLTYLWVRAQRLVHVHLCYFSAFKIASISGQGNAYL
jgi:hypothetical protein